MMIKELADYVEVEGLEYYLTCKNTEWHYLEDKKLLKQCHKLAKASKKIMKKVDKIRNSVL